MLIFFWPVVCSWKTDKNKKIRMGKHFDFKPPKVPNNSPASTPIPEHKPYVPKLNLKELLDKLPKPPAKK